MNLIQSLFYTPKHYRLFQLLCLTTLLDAVLLAYRMMYTGFDPAAVDSIHDLTWTRGTTFLFLGWNLFLAWIPYLLSLTLHRLPARWLAWPVLASWLVFFPNAPYIVTDLLHVQYRPPVPVWYDVLTIFSFAWTGLLLGFISLLNVQHFLEKQINKRLAVIIVWMCLILCAFGVYLGRYQRWNSWDLLTNPYQLFWEMAAVLLHPMAYLGTLGLAVVMGGMLGVGYLTVKTLGCEEQ